MHLFEYGTNVFGYIRMDSSRNISENNVIGLGLETLSIIMPNGPTSTFLN